MQRSRRFPTIVLALAALTTLSGCGNTLFFAERTKAGLSAEFNATAPEPVELTAGYKRTIATLVPPKDPDTTEEGEHKGEALSLVSTFRLAYDRSNNVSVTNFFVTGGAADTIGSSPKAVDALIGVDALAAALRKTNADPNRDRIYDNAAVAIGGTFKSAYDGLAAKVPKPTAFLAAKNAYLNVKPDQARPRSAQIVEALDTASK